MSRVSSPRQSRHVQLFPDKSHPKYTLTGRAGQWKRAIRSCRCRRVLRMACSDVTSKCIRRKVHSASRLSEFACTNNPSAQYYSNEYHNDTSSLALAQFHPLIIVRLMATEIYCLLSIILFVSCYSYFIVIIDIDER